MNLEYLISSWINRADAKNRAHKLDMDIASAAESAIYNPKAHQIKRKTNIPIHIWNRRRKIIKSIQKDKKRLNKDTPADRWENNQRRNKIWRLLCQRSTKSS